MALPKWVWKEVAEVLGVLGIIAGIIFLGFELRQNTNAIRSTTIQEMSNQLVEANFIGVDNPELRLAWQHTYTDSEEVTLADRHILGWYYGGTLRILENRYRQIQLGIFDSNSLDDLFGLGKIYGTPIFLEWWERFSSEHPDDFVIWMEQVVIPKSQIEFERVQN